MSKRTTVADMTIDENHLCGLEFSQREPNGSENVIVIPAEHRQAVALALLGDIDEFVEDLSDALDTTAEDWWFGTPRGNSAVKMALLTALRGEPA
jgi:hypothetical protein